ncbi:DNA-directed RNA polymerase II core subunit rpo21 [Pestalotiopsis sp. IQ-011]
MSAVTFNTRDVRHMDRKSPMVFLSLAPTTSGASAISQDAITEPSATTTTARRTSSLSSASSASASPTTATPPFRFLKLTPVQNGEDSDVAVE